MFDNPILKKMMDQYGHIDDLDKLQAAMREDGFGEFVDLLNNNPELINSFIDEHREDIEQSIQHYTGSGTIPIQEPIYGQPLSNDDTFRFDPQLCLTDCNGKCCKGRNYLMILYPDIFKILTSPAARHLKIHSTQDLLERRPPIIDLFLNEEYDLYLPYLRFLPIGADSNTPPEEAADSICPFLYPISDVFSFHKLQLPQNARKDAMGCMLMDCKPSICRLSPVGQARGMVTGRLSYEYIEPAKNCPGCAADVEIPLPQYVNALLSSSDEEERALFHKMLMAHNTRRQEGYDQKRFKSVLLESYNIDRLLSINDYAPKQRPSYGQLLKILIAAAQGDVSLYDKFIQSMNKSNHKTMKINRNDREYTSYIEQAVVMAYQKLSDLTDRIVANALKELISQKEDRIYRVDYFGAKEEMMHRELLVQINSVGLESKCPKRILVNALKQVLGSVKGFIKQGTADDAYLKFIVDNFK